MDNQKLIKILGISASVIGMGATLLTDYVNDKKSDEKIKKMIDKALTERNK